jgi:hypothetical protein
MVMMMTRIEPVLGFSGTYPNRVVAYCEVDLVVFRFPVGVAIYRRKKGGSKMKMSRLYFKFSDVFFENGRSTEKGVFSAFFNTILTRESKRVGKLLVSSLCCS